VHWVLAQVGGTDGTPGVVCMRKIIGIQTMEEVRVQAHICPGAHTVTNARARIRSAI
jgi:hypothetical protein